MSKYLIDYTDRAINDLNKHKKSGNIASIKKIKSLVKEIAEHPRTGTGHPEQLKGFKDVERWSRRVNKEHRLVYDIEEDVVIVLIVSAYGHYDDR